MKFSIIIPVYNDPGIQVCLDSVNKLNFPREDYEVIVVDNNSTDSTTAIIKKFPVRYIHEAHPGSYRARNAGLKAAQGESMVFTDSDCSVDINWLSEIDKLFSNDKIDGVMGYAGGNNGNIIACYEQRMYEDNISEFINSTDLKRIDTRNFAVKRNVIAKIGHFNEALQFGGDMEYGARAHEAGLKFVFSNSVIISHTNPINLPMLLSKRVRQNFGNMLIIEHHSSQFIRDYFPHLLRYSRSTINMILRWSLWLISKLYFPFAGVVCILLPDPLGYWHFKLMNVIAMRLGQLNYIYSKINE